MVQVMPDFRRHKLAPRLEGKAAPGQKVPGRFRRTFLSDTFLNRFLERKDHGIGNCDLIQLRQTRCKGVGFQISDAKSHCMVFSEHLTIQKCPT